MREIGYRAGRGNGVDQPGRDRQEARRLRRRAQIVFRGRSRPIGKPATGKDWLRRRVTWGTSCALEGKLAEALTNYQQTLALSNELGDRSSTALALQAIGDVLADQGELTGAHRMYEQALAIQQEIGEKSYYAATLVSIGEVLLQQADTDQARKLMEQALSLQEGLRRKGQCGGDAAGACRTGVRHGPAQ